MKKQMLRLLTLLCLVATLVSCVIATALISTAADDAPYLDYSKAKKGLTADSAAGYTNPNDSMKYYTTFAGQYGYMNNGLADVSGAADGDALKSVVASGTFKPNNFQLSLSKNVNADKTIDYRAEGVGIQIDLDFYHDENSTKLLQVRTYKTVDKTKFRYDVIQIGNGAIKKSTKYFVAAEDGSDKTVKLDGYGWHHITVFLRESATVVEGTPSYSVIADVYLNGKKVMSLRPADDFLSGSLFYEIDGTGAITKYHNYYIQGYHSDFYSTTSGVSSSKYGHNRFRNPVATLGTTLNLDGIKSVSYELNGGTVVKTEKATLDEQFVAYSNSHGYFFLPYVTADGTFNYDVYSNSYNKYYKPGQTLLLPTVTKDEAEFLGWGTREGDASSILTPAQTAELSGDTTLYAIFREGRYTAYVSVKGEVTSYKPLSETFTLGNESDYWLVGSALKAKGETITLTENTTVCAFGVSLLEGASARAAEHSGLRFETVIDAPLYEAIGAAELPCNLGTLIIPTDLLGSTEFTAEALDAAEKPYIELTAADSAYPTINPDGSISFFAAIVDIKSQNYARKFSAISYIELGGVRVYTEYSAADNSRSVYEVACASDKAAPDSAYASVIRGFINGVVEIKEGAQVAPYAGYEHPLTATVESGVLTISAAEALTAEDLKTVILDGVNYTGGWTVSDGKLVANLPQN